MIMQYKLVLSDLDGTLLTDEKRLLPSTETTIRKLVKSGALFATASARNKSYTREAILNLSDLCCANAYINGGLIETAHERIILDNPIDKNEIALLIEKCDTENDKPMMTAAGCGVAMKNAHPVIIEMADNVTHKDNNEDGVAEYLRLLYGL